MKTHNGMSNEMLHLVKSEREVPRYIWTIDGYRLP